jgi:endonuclease YncB( thermonuclease family)
MNPLPGAGHYGYDCCGHCSEFQQPTAIMKHRVRRISGTVTAVSVGAFFVCTAAAQAPCKLTAIGTATIAAVRDGRTLMLDDGRELRLAGIEAGDDSHAALQTLAGGRALRLERLGPEQDRYGRLVAFAFAGDDGPSLQAALLVQGRARVSARIGDKGCAEALLTMERAARAAGRGLWADPNFAPLQAENLGRLQAERGQQFALVEGKVLSVRESGATIYVNFGRRWTRDFTVIILKRQGRAFAAAGVEPKQLEGRRIRVRGWIEQRGGPIIAAEAPEQIEFIN